MPAPSMATPRAWVAAGKTALLPVDAAEARVRAACRPLGTERVGLEVAAGRVLRETVRADREFPPLPRARMDGICLRHSDWRAGLRTFPIVGLVRAGDPPPSPPAPGTCLEIMTGAPCPEGCDLVLPYEKVVIAGGLAAVPPGVEAGAWAHIHRRGADYAAGQALLRPGRTLGPAEIGVAAAAGRLSLEVTRIPRVSVLATGDELAAPGEEPAPHQIRLSNPQALAALLGPRADMAWTCLPDRRDALAAAAARALAGADLLLCVGGVSAGRYDFVPEALAAAGVRADFHGVAQCPGKPLYFGLGPAGQPVFGLPGNPVSALVCARRYAVPALRALLGLPPEEPLGLACAIPGDGPAALTRFLAARLGPGPGGFPLARPVAHNGSGHFASLAATDGFIEVPAGRAAAGSPLRYYPWYW